MKLRPLAHEYHICRVITSQLRAILKLTITTSVRQLILHPNNTTEIFTPTTGIVFIRDYKKNVTIHQVDSILVHRIKVGRTRKFNYHIRLNEQCYFW